MVHVEDAAAAAVAAMERGRAGHAYNIVDDEPQTWSSYLRAIARAGGAAAPPIVPDSVLLEAPYLGTLMTRANLSLDNSKAKRELGWTPRYPSVTEGLDAVARPFLSARARPAGRS